jgi:ANTAR domain
VSFGDLRSLGAQQRWPTFAGPAAAAGIHSGVAYPLRVGAARLGVLTLYFEWAMSGNEGARADGLAMAETVTQTILAIQAGAPVNELADGLATAGADQAEVHQASGILAVQLEIGIAEALVRLRSHAYGTGRSIGHVAADVVAHQLRIER